MSGNLLMNSNGAISQRFLAGTGANSVGWEALSDGRFRMYDWQNSRDVISYNPTTDSIDFNRATNVVKKAGDTMTGDLAMSQGKVIRFPNSGGQTVCTLGVDGNGRLYSWSDVAAQGIFTYDPATKYFNLQADTNLMKKTDYTAKDGRADLTLTADATNWNTSRPLIADRRGNTVTIRGAVGLIPAAVGNLVATLPIDVRPTTDIPMTVVATDGTSFSIDIMQDGRINFWTKGKNIYLAFTYVVN